MPSNKFEFTDFSGDLGARPRPQKGCHVSFVAGFILVLLAAVLAVGVGIIVHFAGGSREVVCRCDSGSRPSAEAIKQECVDLAASGDAEVCNKCPSSATIITSTPPASTSPVITTTTDVPKVTDVRLPTSLYPLHYNIELQTYMDLPHPDNFTFKGYVKIWMRCDKATDNVTLHINVLNITEGSIKMGAEGRGSSPTVRSWEEDKARQFLILKLNGSLLPGNIYTVEMNFTSPLAHDLVGLYYSSYKRNDTQVYLAVSTFQPTDARKTFPCFDEPAIKSTYNVTLVRPIDYTSISNMPIIDNSTQFVEGETTYVKDVYEMTPLVSSYLLAFVISDFDYKYTYTTNGTLFRTWARKEAIDQVDYSLEIGANLTTYFEDLFNVHYPLPKQDMIAVPDFVSGAMENWGLITYRETSMLHKEGVSNEANRQRVATIVSHEIAHQWFGNLVTPSWWDDLWLNEGFASFGEYLGVDYAHPDWHIFDVMVVSELHTALSYDGLVSSHPVYVPVSHPDEINEIFDTISYSKGSSIIRMMYHFLGHDTFKKGMHRYLKAKEYAAAFHDDLWNALTEQTLADGKSLNVKEIMDTWTLQMNYPLVTVTVVSPNKIKVSQKRFLEDYNATDPEIYESPFGYRWNIPITLTTNDNDKFSQEIFWLWKNETSKEITLPQANLDVQNGWVLANLDTKGFYRVNYAEKNWEALCKQLLDQHERIPVINRAQIINDAWSLAKSGDIALSTAFKTIDYLHKEKAYAPWYTARRELNYMSSMLSVNSLNGPFQKFMQAKINSSYTYFGFNNSGSSHSEILARSLVVGLACSYGIQSCVDTALSQFKQWMDNPKSNPIDPNFKSTVYCNAISAGGWEKWQFGLRMYTETDMATERSSLLSAMACSRQPWILNHYMGLILEKGSPIRKQDGLTVIIQVASNSVGRPLAWNFFRFHYAEIKEEYSNSVFQWMSIFGSLTRSYNTEFELNELKAFKASNVNNLGTGARNLDQAIETVATNIKWMQVNQKAIQSWLSNATLSTE